MKPPHLRALLILLFILSSTYSSPVFAGSNLETATDASFATSTQDFSPGQTIYVRISADNSGETSHQLNLRDNQYNNLESFTLNKLSGNQFSINFSAPQNEGYYSLESQVESQGSISTSVKTIKVGSPQNASVKVNIQNKVQGQSVTDQFNTNNQKPPSPPANSSPLPTNFSEEPEIFDNPDFTFEDKPHQKSNFLLNLEQFIKILWNSLWPFHNNTKL